MADNIAKLQATGKQKYLNYDIRQPYKVASMALANNLSMVTSQNEYYKTGFLYPSFKMIDPQNQFDKTVVHQVKQTLEFKLDIEPNCVVPMFYFFIQYRNNNTNVTKNITHTSPMINVERITLTIGSNTRYTVKREEILFFNNVRLSHGDKMFTNLIDNLGLSSSYDIDASTNSIPPGSNSKWYLFAIPLFANLNIPLNVLTNNTNQCIIKVDFDAGKFILPSSPNTSYNDLVLYDCKIVVAQTFIPPSQYQDIVKNNILEYRINDTQQSSVYTLDTTSLLNDNNQSIKITARNGGCSLFLIGLRERNNPLTFASFLTINNISIKRKDGSRVKNQAFNTDILRNLNSLELDTGEFFLKKDIVAYALDAAIDRIMIMNHHGAVEVMEDEFNIEFEVLDKTTLSSSKSYELVVMMYQPKLLRVNVATKDVEIKF